MCGPTGGTTPRQSGGGRTAATDRRTLLKVAGAGGAGLVFSTALGASPAAAADDDRRCYVIVLDGLRPGEISSGLMPTVQALRDEGMNYPRARSHPIMETIPNHVMMMTGVRPDRNGVPANVILNRRTNETRTMDRPRDIRVRTVIEALNRSGRTTGTVLSKEYLFEIFGTRATHRWEPAPLIPESDHAPDLFTIEAALAMVEEFDPHLMFLNLGDIDRMGHVDLTGTTLKAGRQAVLLDTDLHVRRFVDMLKSTGRWEKSLLVFIADHSMDWSVPGNLIELRPLLEADPLLAGNVGYAPNGGAELLYWRGERALRRRAIRRMRRLAQTHPGVLVAHDRRAQRSSLRLGRRAGEIVVYCRAGWRIGDGGPGEDAIPGNHGHPATFPIPFFLAGGHPRVPRGDSTERATTVDVAPTVARFFRLGASAVPKGGWDGRSRL